MIYSVADRKIANALARHSSCYVALPCGVSLARHLSNLQAWAIRSAVEEHAIAPCHDVCIPWKDHLVHQRKVLRSEHRAGVAAQHSACGAMASKVHPGAGAVHAALAYLELPIFRQKKQPTVELRDNGVVNGVGIAAQECGNIVRRRMVGSMLLTHKSHLWL